MNSLIIKIHRKVERGKSSNFEGNTCKEARERGLEMLNGPFMIADYSPPVCQSENKTLFEVSTTVCGPQNDFKNHSIHQYRILIDFFPDESTAKAKVASVRDGGARVRGCSAGT